MATDLKLYFTNSIELYNAVYFANAIGDANPGVYNITLQATAANQVPNQRLIKLNQLGYGPTLDANELQAVIADLIDPASNEIFDSSIVTTSGEIYSGSKVRGAMFGLAPAIRHDLTINFLRESDPTQVYDQAANRLEIIAGTFEVNPNDFFQKGDLVCCPGDLRAKSLELLQD